MFNPLGEKIRRLRKEKKLTLEGLAKQSDCSKSYIWELEHRRMPRPSAQKLQNIALALGVTSTYLLDDDQKMPDENVIDNAFFRKYQRLSPDTKKKFRDLIDVWSNE
ncbi:helix-turn-helix domain-containing protein [Magnetococcales bacterium HHB-1]